jgi:hypothetical protein
MTVDILPYLTYCHIDDCCFSVSNISVSHALEMTINFYHQTLELFSFSFTQPFTHSKFCLLNPFLFGATPAINDDRFLIFSRYETGTTGIFLGPGPALGRNET